MTGYFDTSQSVASQAVADAFGIPVETIYTPDTSITLCAGDTLTIRTAPGE